MDAKGSVNANDTTSSVAQTQHDDDDDDLFLSFPEIDWRSPRVIRVIAIAIAGLFLFASGGFVYLRFIRPPDAYLWTEVFPTPYLGELWWKMGGSDLNGLRWTPDGFRIAPKAGQSAFIQFDTTDAVIPLPSWRGSLRRAIGSVPPPSADRLMLDLVAERRGNYLTILERRPLHVQVSQYGVMITLPDASKGNQPTNIMLPDPTRAEGSLWQFERSGTTLVITIDGREIWRGTTPNLDKTIKLGETRADPEHDGSVLIRRVRYGGGV